MTEIENLQKQLAAAKVEIFDLTRRLKNAEFLYWQASHAEARPQPPTPPKFSFSNSSPKIS